MKKRNKFLAVAMSGVMSVSVLGGLTGCRDDRYDEFYFNDLSMSLAMSLMGNDVFAWNVYSATPYETYGYNAPSAEQASWYSYDGVRSSSDISMVNYIFDSYYDELKHFNPSKLSAESAATYRTMENILDTYRAYYKSKYVNTFELLGGSYISSEGGYVADFALSFENFTFRTEKDVKALLAVTQSTEDAFSSYLNFAKDRDKAGYPLYDYTLNSMQEYLEGVFDKGEDYYLYNVAQKKIDDAEFLSQNSKASYKAEYKAALDENFMTGIKTLSDGLSKYKGRVETADKSYLASAGKAGKAYYEWLFRQKSGIKNADLSAVYNEVYVACQNYYNKCDSLLAQVNALEETDSETYTEFYEYYNGTKMLLGLTDPTEILEYLKVAAKDIVPDLETEPQIGFKYMDDTVAERTNSLAYYVRTPLDQKNSNEMITLNAYQMENDPSNLLTTIAHEGYPGHLYAHVNAKEKGASLLSTIMSNSAFSEGWANYTELVLLENISKAESSSKATKLYCEYQRYYILSGYVGSFIADMQVNYFGATAADFQRPDAIEVLMEIPAMYVPYGYGMYTMYTLHEKAKQGLGGKYNEAEFNGVLLSEGFGPTLARARQITDSFIAKKKKK